MLVKEIMKRDYLSKGPGVSLREAVQSMNENGYSFLVIEDKDGFLVGIITNNVIQRVVLQGIDIKTRIDNIMLPLDKVKYIYPDTEIKEAFEVFNKNDIRYMPVIESENNKRVTGILSQRNVINHYLPEQINLLNESKREKRARVILDSLNEGLIVVDKDLIVTEFNPAAERLTGLRAVDRIGQKSVNRSNSKSITEVVMETGEPQYNVETQLQDGRIFLVNYVPLKSNGHGQIDGIIQTFSDITTYKSLQDQLSRTKEELDKAFALTLPNSKVEYKLKSTPEYRDEFDNLSSTITVTEIIEGGGYLHVVNCLKVAADFNEMGLMKLIGINKDTLVEAIIFHDLGKSQPVLSVGDKVTPEDVFEEGIYHAARSADIAGKFYGKDEDVVNIIRYHHHPEDLLPEDFPSHLLPLLRLFKIIDGLSAALTRRNASVRYETDGSRLTIFEENQHPKYNRVVEIDLYTGKGFERPMGGMSKNGVN